MRTFLRIFLRTVGGLLMAAGGLLAGAALLDLFPLIGMTGYFLRISLVIATPGMMLFLLSFLFRKKAGSYYI